MNQHLLSPNNLLRTLFVRYNEVIWRKQAPNTFVKLAERALVDGWANVSNAAHGIRSLKSYNQYHPDRLVSLNLPRLLKPRQ